MTMLFSLFTLSVLSSFYALGSARGPYRHDVSSSFSHPDVLPPSQDPWYTAPAGYQNTAPGTILRIRSAPGNLTKIFSASAVYNILYRTTDSNYHASWAVTTLFIPATNANSSSSPLPAALTGSANSSTAPGTALLSYLIPYDSSNVDSSPSYTAYSPSQDPTYNIALSRGWFLSVPDYEGPLASFTAGVNSGHATLDSVRAVLNCGLGLTPDAKYALYGYSGGALAGEWAAELQNQYAPELNIAGAALGGLTPNITSVVETVNRGPNADLVVNGVLGLTSQYPAARAYVISQLQPSGPTNASTFLAALNQSTAVDSRVFANQDIFAYFANGSDLLRQPQLQRLVYRDGIMGYHGIPQMPVFAYKAIADDQSQISDTDALVERYCAVGANILYQRNTVGRHVTEAINGALRVLAFLSAVFDGSYASQYNATGCTIQNVTVNITGAFSSLVPP